MTTPPPAPDPAPADRGVRAVLRRRPATWLVVTAVDCLGAGAAIGQGDTVPKADLDKAEARVATLDSRLTAAQRRLDDSTRENTALRGERDAAADRAAKAVADAKRITARGKVPNFSGRRVDGIRESQTVQDFEWQVTQTSRISGAVPGTVIKQDPAPGRTLDRGATVRLTVAKKAPPKPKQWVTTYSTSGSGAKRTGEFSIPSGQKVRVRYSFGGDTNDTLQLKEPEEGDDSFGDLIVNEIGVYSGTSRLYGKSGTYYLDVDGGSWTIEVQVFKRP